jgi:uncharacterized membrane protein
MPDLSFSPVGGHWLVALCALGLLALLVLGPLGSSTTPRRRAALVGLRLAVFLLVILAMLRPTLIYTAIKKQQATLVVLVDRSRSMLVADAFANKTRWQALETAIKDATPALAELAQDLEVKLYAFDADAYEIDFDGKTLDLGPAPDGQQSAIGWVMEDVLRRETGKRLAGVILLSDGAVRAYSPRDVPPQAPARRLQDLGYKLYTVAFGQARGVGQAKDLSLKDLTANQTVFVKNQLVAGGRLRIDGFVDQQVPLQLLFETAPGKMEPVATRTVKSAQDAQEFSLELSHVPQTPGEFKLTLKAPPQPGELVTTNNELSTFVTVLDGGLNVLYLQGKPRAEQRFLKSSLDSSPDINVDFKGIDPQKPQTRPPDFAKLLEPGKYDVYLLGDIDSSAFTADELAAMKLAVDRGAGLMMLGGLYSFGPGGYAETPLADILPIEMNRLERQRFEDATRADVHIAGPLKMRPPRRAGSPDYIMHLADDNQALWDKLTLDEGANRLGKLKPAAHLLAETESGQPLLVAQEAGNGRVLAFAGDSTWRWVMHGHAAAHKRFWRQVILWLARKDETSAGAVWVRIDQRRHHPSSRVEFAVGARTAQHEPIVDAEFRAEVLLPDGGRRPMVVVRQGQESAGSFFETEQAGDYTITVTATRDSVPLGTAKARFLVYEQDLELDNAVAERGLLDMLASTTGGESLAPEQLPELLEKLKQVPQDLQIEVQTKKTLWDTWPLFLLLALLLSVEWFLRKRWGLV